MVLGVFTSDKFTLILITNAIEHFDTFNDWTFFGRNFRFSKVEIFIKFCIYTNVKGIKIYNYSAVGYYEMQIAYYLEIIYRFNVVPSKLLLWLLVSDSMLKQRFTNLQNPTHVLELIRDPRTEKLARHKISGPRTGPDVDQKYFMMDADLTITSSSLKLANKSFH